MRRLIRGFLAAVVLFGVAFNVGSAQAVSAATSCVGDCNGDGYVTVDDILTMVNIALGNTPVATCETGDANDDGEITVDEILAAVNNALNGCGADTQTKAEAAPVVVSTTTNSLGAVDFGCVYAAGCALPTPTTSGAGRQPRFRLAGSARVAIADAGSQADACPTVSCTVAGEMSTLTTTYAGCQTVTAGHTIVRNGTVTQSVADASFCDTRTIPADAVSTLTLSGFTLTETDSSGAALASIMATITETFGPTGAQCGTLASGTETIDGSESFTCAPGAQTVDCPAAGADLTLTAQNLVLQRTTNNGVPCTLTVTAQGELDTQNALTGERFDETFAQTQFAESTTIGGDGTTLSVEGSLAVGCLGSLDLQTPRPIVIAADAACPSGGILQVAQPVPGEAPTSSTAQRADAVAAAQATVPTLAEPVNTIDENDGFRQGVFRAANGQVYHVLQNVSAGADLGAEAFQVTSVVGSAAAVGVYYQQPSIGYSGLAAVGVTGGQAIRSDLIRKSPVIQRDVSQPPCFSSAGDGSVCVGTDCGADCGCPSGGACETFSVGEGAPITTSTDTPAARFVGALQTAIQDLNGGATYAFGPSGPTTEADTCQPAPTDGFALSVGNSIIFAYETPLATRFTVGYAGFPVDQDGKNPFGCPAGTLVGAGPAIAHLTLPPRMIEFTDQGGITFDFNQDGLTDLTLATCQQTVAQCVAATPLPTQTPTPAPPSPTPTPTGTLPPPPPTVTGTPPTSTPTGTPSPTGTPPPTPTPTVSLPDLIITQLIAGVSPALPGQTTPVTVTVGNQGNADAGPFAVTFVFSTDMTISPDDAQSSVSCQFAGLAAQATATCSQLVTITATLLPGTYYLGAIADASGQVVESDKSNNTRLANTGTPAQQPFSFGQTLAGTISVLEANTYTFFASGGDVVLLAMTATSGTLVPEIKVFGSGPSPVCSAAPGFCVGSTVEITDCALPATGTYTVLVDDCGGNTQTGNYSLYLQRLNQPGGASALAFGQTLSATIFAAAEKDTYTFAASAGDVVELAMTTTSGALVPEIGVYRPNGTQACGAAPGFCVSSTVEITDCALPATGTYTVLVDDCGNSNLGDYNVYLQRLNQPGGASPIAPGVLVSSAISKAAEKDTYTFSTTAGGLVDIGMATVSGALVPDVNVYNSAGGVVCSEAPGFCEGSTVELGNCALPGAGTYAIIVDDCSDANTGDYDLSLTCITAPCLSTTPAPTNTRPNTPMNTPSATSTPTPTLPPTTTPTITPTPPRTATPSITSTPTQTQTRTNTGTNTATATNKPTNIPTSTPTGPTPTKVPTQVVFFEDFEHGWGDWYADNGIWQVGLPSSGPGGCFNGSAHCAATNLTGTYPDNSSSTLISPNIQLPAITADQQILLGFKQWLGIGSWDSAVVEISDETAPGVWSAWQSLASSTTPNSGAGWGIGTLLDISSHAGQTVRIGFLLSQGNSGFPNYSTAVGPGWYIDNVEVSINSPPAFQVSSSTPFSAGGGAGWADWSADSGVWQVGLPTSGPGSCFNGSAQCAATNLKGTYPDNSSSTLISPNIQLPAITADQRIRLSFEQWLGIGSWDSAVVEISDETAPGVWSAWQSLASSTTSNSGAGWGIGRLLDISSYAGQTVRIGFLLSQGNSGFPNYSVAVGPGWYIDDVEVSINSALAFQVSSSTPFSAGDGTGWGDWYADNGIWQVGLPTSGPGSCFNGSAQCAATNLKGTYPDNSSSTLISPNIQLPAITADQVIRLRFEQWVAMGSWDNAVVEIADETAPGVWSAWQSLASYTTSSGAWAYPLLDISSYAGQTVRIGFLLSQGNSGFPNYSTAVGPGWYIDDIEVSVN